MKIKTEGSEYWIKFQYDRKKPEDETSRDTTTCFIMTGEIEVAQVTIRCHPNVQFCRATGRKIALGLAVCTLFPIMDGMSYDKVGMLKDQRRKFWEGVWVARQQVEAKAQAARDLAKGQLSQPVNFTAYSV